MTRRTLIILVSLIAFIACNSGKDEIFFDNQIGKVYSNSNSINFSKLRLEIYTKNDSIISIDYKCSGTNTLMFGDTLSELYHKLEIDGQPVKYVNVLLTVHNSKGSGYLYHREFNPDTLKNHIFNLKEVVE